MRSTELAASCTQPRSREITPSRLAPTEIIIEISREKPFAAGPFRGWKSQLFQLPRAARTFPLRGVSHLAAGDFPPPGLWDGGRVIPWTVESLPCPAGGSDKKHLCGAWSFGN